MLISNRYAWLRVRLVLQRLRKEKTGLVEREKVWKFFVVSNRIQIVVTLLVTLTFTGNNYQRVFEVRVSKVSW